jgi:hypothetical protein
LSSASTCTGASPHDELELTVRAEHAGKEARLAQDLEAVADPEHRVRRPRANSRTAPMIGATLAIAPVRR